MLTLKQTLSWLAMVAFLSTSLMTSACTIFGDDDDDDSVGDDDDSAGDDDDAAGDDDDSAGDDDDSAGDDDDATDPLMSIDALEVGCEPDTSAADQHSRWRMILRTFGWVAGAPDLFLWDHGSFEANDGNDRYYTDAWAPFTDWNNGDPLDPVDELNGIGEDGEFDTWYIDFGGYAASEGNPFGPAEDNDGTFLRCEQSTGVPNVDILTYMVCADDFFYANLRHCYLCGNTGLIGESAGTFSTPYGTIGEYMRDIDGDGTDEVFEVTEQWDATDVSDDNPCFLGVDVWSL